VNYEEIKRAVLTLDAADKKRLVLETFPELSRDAIKDPGFVMQLFPPFLDVLRESGLDLQQLVKLVGMLGGTPQNATTKE